MKMIKKNLKRSKGVIIFKNIYFYFSTCVYTKESLQALLNFRIKINASKNGILMHNKSQDRFLKKRCFFCLVKS